MTRTDRRYLSPLRYPGGKARMSRWVSDLFWQQVGVEIWIEPFAGGAGAALHAVIDQDVPEAWLIEKHPGLAAFWRTVLAADARDSEALADRVAATTPTLAMYDQAREKVAAVLAETDDADNDLEVAFAAFLLNRCSRSGIVHPRSGPVGGRTQQGRWRLADRWNPAALSDRIRHIASYRSRIRLLPCEDGIDYIAGLADSGIEDEVMLFVDPPYVEAGNRLYGNGMDEDTHQQLADALHGCPTPWILTYDAHPRVLEFYRDDVILQYGAPHTATTRRLGQEYVILGPTLRLPWTALTHPLGSGEWAWVQGDQGYLAEMTAGDVALGPLRVRHLEPYPAKASNDVGMERRPA